MASMDALYPPLQGRQLVLATVAVALATFMTVLDSSIANVAIPTISGNLGVSLDEGTWVITVFAAANAIFQHVRHGPVRRSIWPYAIRPHSDRKSTRLNSSHRR